VANQLKRLRQLWRKARLGKSPRNVEELIKVQKNTDEILKNAEYDWWLTECEKLQGPNEHEKWKITNKLTNQSSYSTVQPIKKTVNGNDTYLYDDNDILTEMEDYYIRKAQQVAHTD